MLPSLFAHGTPFVDLMVAQVRANLDLALARLAACPALVARPPDGGYYLVPAVRGWGDEEALALHLIERGVLAHPGFYYGEPPGTHLMISALTAPAALAEGLERLVAALE